MFTDPENKNKNNWPIPTDLIDAHPWLGLTNYSQNYSKNFAAITKPLTNPHKKDAEWCLSCIKGNALTALEKSLPSCS